MKNACSHEGCWQPINKMIKRRAENKILHLCDSHVLESDEVLMDELYKSDLTEMANALEVVRWHCGSLEKRIEQHETSLSRIINMVEATKGGSLSGQIARLMDKAQQEQECAGVVSVVEGLRHDLLYLRLRFEELESESSKTREPK